MVVTANARAIGEAIAMHFEGCRLRPYLDSGRPPNATIGWGTRVLASGAPVTMHTPPITQAEADELFDRAFGLIVPRMQSMLMVSLPDNQVGALLSLQYNVGSTALARSTLMMHVNQREIGLAADDFLDWDRTGNTVSAGLLRRRQYERSVFLGTTSPQADSLAVDGTPRSAMTTDQLNAAELHDLGDSPEA